MFSLFLIDERQRARKENLQTQETTYMFSLMKLNKRKKFPFLFHEVIPNKRMIFLSFSFIFLLLFFIFSVYDAKHSGRGQVDGTKSTHLLEGKKKKKKKKINKPTETSKPAKSS